MDDPLREAVTAAKLTGQTWTDVGEALGSISKQAAQKRFG